MVNKNHIHVKLQDAHTAETGAAGTWAAIDINTATEGWRATAKTALNDCKISSF